MQLGYVLLRDQLFFRRELRERVFWFIQLRWIATGVALAGSWTAYLLGLELPILPLSIIVFFIVLYNTIFLFIARRLDSFRPRDVKPFTIFAHSQISLDLLALYLLIYFTGGISSPLLIFILFHIILAGILLSPISCYVYGVLVTLALGILISLENTKLLPLQSAVFQSSLLNYSREYPDVLVPYLTFATAIFISAFLITSVKVTIRTKGRELLRISQELDSSNAKLTALYEMVKEMSLKSDLQELMDSATLYATRIMGVKACSIKLLDEQRRSLRFASTYGLSEDYISKGGIDIEKSPINLRIVEGSLYAIGRIDEEDYFQYPEDIRKEGISSMLCLPLIVEKMVLGVFCVYSDESHHFGHSDTEFFSLMTDLTALAIENLKSQEIKSWFMIKAAHQLRSPLNAIYSMLKMLREGYLGVMNEEQRGTLERCERRIDILGDLIDDLLKLGKERAEAGSIELYPVDLTKIMNPLVHLYETQASEKGLDIQFHIQTSIPEVQAEETCIDELFTNLISNAIKYTPSGGHVRVTLTSEDEGQVRFEVSDTGIGIPEEDVPRLFSEFFRAENAKAMVEEGTGLGLVIVREIIDRLRGTIQVKSKAGEGTCITCLLPSIDHSEYHKP